MNAIIHGIVLAFGLILPLGVQNVFIFQQGAWQKHSLAGTPRRHQCFSLRHPANCISHCRRICHCAAAAHV